MKKEELRKLRRLSATREMMQKTGEYDIMLRVQELNSYVKIALFLQEKMAEGINTPRYEIFLNVPGGEYLTRELDDTGKELRWSTAMLWNLPGIYRYDWYYDKNNKKIYISGEEEETIKFLPLKDKRENIVGVINRWQQEQRDEKTRQKEKKEQEKWDADMDLVQNPPKDFVEWMRKDVTEQVYIFYEYDRKGQRIGYCSRCRKRVAIKDPRNGGKTKCPACRKEAVFKAHTRISTLGTGKYNAELIQKIKGGIVIRSFWQRQNYREKQYTTPEISTYESQRVLIFDDGTVREYEMGLYKNKYHRWIPAYATNHYVYYGENTKLYKKNLKNLKTVSTLKKSAIDLWPILPVSTASYLRVERELPVVEMLARVGMFGLAKQIISKRHDDDIIEKKETELYKILKIDRARLKRLKGMEGNLYHLKWLQTEKQEDTVWPDQMIKDFGEARFEPDAFSFLPGHLSAVRCYNYLKKQAAAMDESLEQTLSTWKDYMNMAKKVKMDTKSDQIRIPKKLAEEHAKLIEIIQQGGMEKQARKIEKEWPEVNRCLEKLKKFEYTAGEYTIVAPESILDIVREGTILRHCVHTCDYYFDRIQKNESYLFFLRRKDVRNAPWYTLEVEPSGNIRQKRTIGDKQGEDLKKATSFLKKWQQYFRHQLTEEEKKLGEMAEELRKENYKKLRENGNRVWHGPLAGKLLADVLEQDFMPAV